MLLFCFGKFIYFLCQFFNFPGKLCNLFFKFMGVVTYHGINKNGVDQWQADNTASINKTAKYNFEKKATVMFVRNAIKSGISYHPSTEKSLKME